MAKKGRKRFDLKAKTRHKESREDDAAWRATFLLGAAHLLSGTAPTVARRCVETTRQIGRRINLSVDSVTVKRATCNRCARPLLGAARVRVAPRRETHVVVTCPDCNHVRRFPVARRRQRGRAAADEGATRQKLEEAKDTVETTAPPPPPPPPPPPLESGAPGDGTLSRTQTQCSLQ